MEQMEEGKGDVWAWTARDADSKLILSYLVGQRGPRWAKSLEDVASPVASRIHTTTAGLKACVEAIVGACELMAWTRPGETR